jgi:hypothetical protein
MNLNAQAKVRWRGDFVLFDATINNEVVRNLMRVDGFIPTLKSSKKAECKFQSTVTNITSYEQASGYLMTL